MINNLNNYQAIIHYNSVFIAIGVLNKIIDILPLLNHFD